MRTQQEMMDLIMHFATQNDLVRVVGMEGSRTNKNVPTDDFQDYDISYMVSDMQPFLENDAWLDYFGKRIIMQKPEAMELFAPELGNWFSYLMLFEDGNRIDLTLIPLNELTLYMQSDKLLTILLDKDNLVENIPVPTDEDYHVKKPTVQMFDDCCNEFWWVSTYVVKGLCRKELLYAAEHLNSYVRPMLLQMMAWQVGFETGFSLSVGKSYKYLHTYIPDDVWRRLLTTYHAGSAEEIWQALLQCYSLFREYAASVASAMPLQNAEKTYLQYDENVTAYVKDLYEKHMRR